MNIFGNFDDSRFDRPVSNHFSTPLRLREEVCPENLPGRHTLCQLPAYERVEGIWGASVC